MIAAQESEITVNLLLTRQCNFKCDHCMFRAGPHLSGTYMSYEDLEAIAKFILQLTGAGINVSVNLVGGEPTLRMNEFARCAGTLSRLLRDEDGEYRHINFEMTTNGWWLRSWPTTLSFVKALRDANLMGEITVRISESDFHKPHRGKEADMVTMLAKTKDPTDRIWEMTQHWDEQERERADPVFECRDCGHEQRCSEGVACQGCERHCDEERDEVYDDLPGSREREMHGYWLQQLFGGGDTHGVYVDMQASHGIVPVGRALDLSLGQHGGSCHKHTDIKFTFEPGGVLHDACCNGGHAPLGHASDGWLLFMRRIGFIGALHDKFPDLVPRSLLGNASRCRGCALYAGQWLKSAQPRRDVNMRAAADFLHAVEADPEVEMEEYVDACR